MSDEQIQEITETIDSLWELYEDAQNAGDTASADGYAAQAFLLIERLPQNRVYLQTVQ